jgi:peptidoglycan/LPS O-acetylase OafA/YrhL
VIIGFSMVTYRVVEYPARRFLRRVLTIRLKQPSGELSPTFVSSCIAAASSVSRRSGQRTFPRREQSGGFYARQCRSEICRHLVWNNFGTVMRGA